MASSVSRRRENNAIYEKFLSLNYMGKIISNTHKQLRIVENTVTCKNSTCFERDLIGMEMEVFRTIQD
ncbi:hypothetical protein HNY73_010390 [Argiope bruennichi]|uniref:Uncharacterized protein n=1 Tax=Argiope bruennichi TaxID=94029 RepID=A0A8T0F0Y7_ARGBR|nr:hypothetical protein HNY73_010390 [Argiope bruennichi]